MNIEEVSKYLKDVKILIEEGKYRIDTNRKRQKNRELFERYLINEAESKKMLLSLCSYDFSEAVRNEHPDFEYETLYIFGKDVKLRRRYMEVDDIVPLYIKINKVSKYVIVISFHKQEFPLSYAFK